MNYFNLKNHWAIFALIILIGCSSKEKTESNSTELPMAQFEELAPNYVNQTIHTTGIVDHVCKHGGKKILLVTDDYSLHVLSEERFDENLVGTEIVVTGILGEDVIDESTFQRWEENANTIEEHDRKVGALDYIEMMRDSLKACGKDHFSEYYVTYVSHKSVE